MKNIKRKYLLHFIVIIFVAITMLVTSCTTGVSSTSFKTGTNGLVMEFAKANPTSVYEREQFDTSLFIRNIGSYDISSDNPATLKVLYDTYRLASKQGSASIDVTGIALNGKSRYNPAGSEAPVEVSFESNSLTHLREGAKTTISYNLCYPYSTEFTTMTCIDTKTASKADLAAACTSETYNGASGQGAPIVVTKIEPEILLQQDYVRPQFKIYIENMGGGYVSSKTTCDNSENSVFNDNTNAFSGRVTVHATLSGETLDCGADKSGSLRLVDSDSSITCYLSNNGQDKYARTKKNYLSPLTIRVDYTYVSLDKQDIEIKRNDLIEPDVTQGLCLSYQVEYNGECVNKCDYCAQPEHSAELMCQEGKPYDGFTFRANFSCKCNLVQCNVKEGVGSCIKGYCPGSLYCCSALNCDQWEVEYHGECIDKCKYCSEINSSDTKICGQNFNFQNFECLPMLKEDCENVVGKGACILGYCGTPDNGQPGDQNVRYCANLAKIKTSCPPVDNPSLTIVSPIGTCMNLCDYCAQYGQNEARCKYTDKGQVKKILSNFGCNCKATPGNPISGVDFLPSDAYCGSGSGVYCCGPIATN